MKFPLVFAVVFLLTPTRADETTYPGNSAFQEVDGVRFYSQIVPQPWRDSNDVIEGFDWSLPPSVQPAPNAFMKGYWDMDPKAFPGRLLGVAAASWRELEPEEGHYDFSILEKRIGRLKARGYAAVELHIYASVRDVEYDDDAGKPLPPDRLSEQQKRVRQQDSSAPLWLDKYNIPTTRNDPQIGTDDHIVNYDIFNPQYHQRYLKMVAALGRTPIPHRTDIGIAYIHMISSTRGEENDGAFPGDPNHPRMVERLKAWADAFGPDKNKLMFTGFNEQNLRIAYGLGIGQRNGYVERYLLHTYNPALGQSMDTDGHLVVDESLPPIADNLAFGDENEEYDPSSNGQVIRFGPRSTWPHRYREAALRELQMRRNYSWEPALSPDPYLTAYVANELGRTVRDTPDAWCYLRESYVHEKNEYQGNVVPVKNFERWLCQRDLPGFPTRAVKKVDYPEPTENFVRNVYVPGTNYDLVAREGQRFGFALDARFMQGQSPPVAIKITYYDETPWTLVYSTSTGPREKSWPCRADGALRTATFFLKDFAPTAKGMAPDFEIRALAKPAVIRFVRIIRLTP